MMVYCFFLCRRGHEKAADCHELSELGRFVQPYFIFLSMDGVHIKRNQQKAEFADFCEVFLHLPHLYGIMPK